MKKIASSVALAALTLATAMPVLAQETGDWSGAYGGVFVSAVSGKTDVDRFENILLPDIPGLEISADGAEVGGLVGYNFQNGSWVYGVELSVATGGAEGNELFDTVDLDETFEWKSKSTIGLSGRVGTVVGETLFFGSVGLSRMEAETGYLNYFPDLVTIEQDFRSDTTFKGFTLGLGLERALAETTTIRAEILHSEYSTEPKTFAPGSGDLDYSPSTTALRAGFSFRF